MFCPNCGTQANEGAAFCENCGTKLIQPAAGTMHPADADSGRPLPQATYAGNGEVREGIPAPGYSDRVNHPEILAAIKKQRGAAVKFMFVLVPIPLIGFLLYSMITGEMEMGMALRGGGIVSLIFLAFALYSFIKSRPSQGYEGVVTKKETKLHKKSDKDGDYSYEYSYIIHVKTTDGKKKKIVETDHGRVMAFTYLNEGDKFRYHPQFAWPYELYDKSRADGLYCVVCQKKNPVTADRCEKCHAPLLK